MARFFLAVLFAVATSAASGQPWPGGPNPLLKQGEPVTWWFVFKLNASSFPGCSGPGGDAKTFPCPFDADGKHMTKGFGQRFVYASNSDQQLHEGIGCTGGTEQDPVGATFAQIYDDGYFYVIWNDQPQGHPRIPACSGADCNSPWGHSKGVLAWNGQGQGMVMQITTPSWPLSGNKKNPRRGASNTLGCVYPRDPKATSNNVKLSQHFFALALSKADVLAVLEALENASAPTDPALAQLVRNGGPADVQQRVAALGKKSKSKQPKVFNLSSGAMLISKPSALHVPPWQMVSSLLKGAPLRTATFWGAPQIPSTTATSSVTCWDSAQLKTKPGPVKIATSGEWSGTAISLSSGGNHAKIGVSISADKQYVIFGDMNQQGALSGDAKNCARSQNGRGGLFFVLQNQGKLAAGVAELIDGDTAPTKPAKSKTKSPA